MRHAIDNAALYCEKFQILMRSIHRLNIVALIFYTALAFILLHPLIFHTGTHAAGFDYFNYNWNFWWIRHAFTHGLNIYETNFVFFPTVNNFGYHALTAFWYPVWAILEPFFGTLTAVTVIIFVGCVLNGYLVYIWLRSEGIAPALALIGGAALQALPISRYFYYNSHLNLMDWFWIPAHLLFWKQIVHAAEAKRISALVLWSVIMGIGVWGLGLTDLQFPIFVAFALVPYGVWTLWKSPARLWLIPAGLVVVSIGAGLLWFAGPLPYIAQFSGTLAPGDAEERPGVPFPSGFLSMSETWWQWDTPSLGWFITVALIVSLVAAISLAKRGDLRRTSVKPASRWFWLIVALPPMIMSMGATLQLGDLAIPLPFRLLHTQTSGMFRMPWRLAPIFVICALAFIGQTWTLLLPRLHTKTRPDKRCPFAFVGMFLALAVSVRLFETALLQPVLPAYEFYEQMREEPYEYMVLEVPTGVGTGEVLLGEARAIQYQFYGMTHEKWMLNGFVSRAPLDPLWSIYLEDPMMAWLGQRRPLIPDTVRREMVQRIYNYPIGYIVLHRDMIGENSSTLQEVVGFFNQNDSGLCPPVTEADVILYRTRWHPDGCDVRMPPEIEAGVYQIDIGSNDDFRYIGWGWHWQESIFDMTMRWTGENLTAEVYVDLPPATYEVSIAAQAFWEARELSILVDGQSLGDPVTVTTEALHTFTFQIPADRIGDGEHTAIALEFDDVIVPSQVGQSADERRLAIMVDWIRFTRQAEVNN
jgi:hypothetical protein